MNELHLFAGAGGGILGGILLGHTPVCAVEINPYCQKVLLQRQRDGILPMFPVWGDIREFDGKPWRGIADVVCGGFPCTDISCAGKGAGIKGKESGLWSEMARIIGEIRPKYAFVENSPMLTLRGLDRVLGDLSTLGFDAKWGVLGAHHVGAPHRRERIWIVGNAVSERLEGHAGDGVFFNQCRWDFEESRRPVGAASVCIGKCDWWATEPDLGRVAHGVANRVDRLKAIGNGQVPAVAALAWRILGGGK